MEFVVDNMSDLYKQVGKYLLDNGDVVSPRGKETKEILCPTITLVNPKSRLCYNSFRKFSLVYAITEALMLFSYSDDVRYFSRFNKNIENFSDDGLTLHGAYGKRMAYCNQVYDVISRLENDQFTRQAVITINNAKDDRNYKGKDMPCTMSLMFSLRNNKLNMTTTMRSNDIIWGLPYDTFMFTCLQEAIANTLNVDVGWYKLIPMSLHVYKDFYCTLEYMADDSSPYYFDLNRDVHDMAWDSLKYRNIVDCLPESDIVNAKDSDFVNIVKLENLFSRGYDVNKAYKLSDYSNCIIKVPSWARPFTKRWYT